MNALFKQNTAAEEQKKGKLNVLNSCLSLDIQNHWVSGLRPPAGSLS
jgi:hypothetical protein